MPRKNKKNIHYVNNAEFSQAVVDYVKIADKANLKIKDIKSNKNAKKVK